MPPAENILTLARLLQFHSFFPADRPQPSVAGLAQPTVINSRAITGLSQSQLPFLNSSSLSMTISIPFHSLAVPCLVARCWLVKVSRWFYADETRRARDEEPTNFLVQKEEEDEENKLGAPRNDIQRVIRTNSRHLSTEWSKISSSSRVKQNPLRLLQWKCTENIPPLAKCKSSIKWGFFIIFITTKEHNDLLLTSRRRRRRRNLLGISPQSETHKAAAGKFTKCVENLKSVEEEELAKLRIYYLRCPSVGITIGGRW